MRRVREILKMKFEAGMATRAIGRQTGIPRRTVRTLFERFEARGLTCSSRSCTFNVKRAHQRWAEVSMRWCRMRTTSRLESDWR